MKKKTKNKIKQKQNKTSKKQNKQNKEKKRKNYRNTSKSSWQIIIFFCILFRILVGRTRAQITPFVRWVSQTKDIDACVFLGSAASFARVSIRSGSCLIHYFSRFLKSPPFFTTCLFIKYSQSGPVLQKILTQETLGMRLIHSFYNSVCIILFKGSWVEPRSREDCVGHISL